VKQAILLLAHGAPERVEDVECYLSYVRGGKPVSPATIAEVKQRYAEIGGASPLLKWTSMQAEGLQAELQRRGARAQVYFGMRNWHPFIRETMQQIKDDGIERIVAVCLAPQYSKMSVGLYFRRTQEAKQETGSAAEIVWTKSFHRHPALIEAFAEKLRPVADGRQVVFTAHSLPEKILDSADPYDAEAKATARAVADRVPIPDWDFAYQSQGMTDDKWLGPSVESCIDGYAQQGVNEIVLAPVGFVCDHVEILYDVDLVFRRYAEARGIRLVRPESLNDSPKLIEALADVAGEKLLPG
jgi:ferrochelatase